jgi:hypothetical protein
MSVILTLTATLAGDSAMTLTTSGIALTDILIDAAIVSSASRVTSHHRTGLLMPLLERECSRAATVQQSSSRTGCSSRLNYAQVREPALGSNSEPPSGFRRAIPFPEGPRSAPIQALRSAAAGRSIHCSRQEVSKILHGERRKLILAQFVYPFARGRWQTTSVPLT